MLSSAREDENRGLAVHPIGLTCRQPLPFGADRHDAPLGSASSIEAADRGARRAMGREGLAGAIAAGAAGRRDPQVVLKLIEAGAAVACCMGDVAVGDAMADANDHAPV